MGEIISVRFSNGQTCQYPKGVTVLDMSQEEAGKRLSPIVAAKVNNELWDLQIPVEKDSVVEFLDLHSDEGIKVYQRSLTFVLVTAAAELFPDSEITVEHSLSKGLYCELHRGAQEGSEQDVAALEKRMEQIIAEDRPIIRKVITLQQAIELFEGAGRMEKVKLLSQRSLEYVNIYYCGHTFDYFYGTMVPRTGYLQKFGLKFYPPGLILRFPEKENPADLPPFQEHPKLAKVFLEAEQWGKIMHCGYVGDLNEYNETDQLTDIIRVAEALHEKKVAQIADFISEHRKEVRVILVAGPSSSGKTTFAQRLTIQLRVNGVRPVPISLDDYFVNRDNTPRDDKGNYDFEAIEAIDLELFNEHLTRILAGEEVKIPSYNFITGVREYRGHTIRINKDQPLIIEGIHGLNERLTCSITKEHKVKIYISALTQLSIDNHNRIPTTDGRLIRRIVRDSQFRSHDALRTLQMWPSVRRGEERNIFPFQEEADIMFNSALIYELAVLKDCAAALLEKVEPHEEVYSEARRLLSFLAYFKSAESNHIPPNSILLEFVGNSCFY